eukprot:m.273947 g.273947  ORF g.273947 m.273947 type:complete len:76 (-) comp26890_c0_seq1:41-268(-)
MFTMSDAMLTIASATHTQSIHWVGGADDAGEVWTVLGEADDEKVGGPRLCGRNEKGNDEVFVSQHTVSVTLHCAG